MANSAFFKSARVYRLTGPVPAVITAPNGAEDTLWERRFSPLEGSMVAQSFGWVPVDTDVLEGGPLAYFPSDDNDAFMVRLRVESRVLPSAVIKKELAERAHQVAEQQGYAVGRRQMRDLRETVIDDLMPKAFTTYAHIRALVDPENKLLFIEATSDSKCDVMISFLIRTFDGLGIGPLRMNTAPTAAMNEWLLGEEPDGFTIDNDGAKFGDSPAHGGVVSYKNVDAVEQAKWNIRDSRNCTQLAMTWTDRISFTLDSKFTLRSITPLDTYSEGAERSEDKEEQFQSEAFIFATDIVQLIIDLIEAMGGTDDGDDPAAGL